MVLRWTATGISEAQKDSGRVKAHKQQPILKAALDKLRDPQAVDIVGRDVWKWRL